MTTASKNKLSQCRTRDALFNVLAIECEHMHFDYDMAQSMRKNAARARIAANFDVVEIINWAERVEPSL
jgi:aromatic ring-cleaving dioxygenase